MARRFAVAVSFLTCLPLGLTGADEEEVGRSVAFFPLVGLVLGLILVAATWLLGERLPAPVVAGLLVALLAVLTGGLHLDGLADTFDALGARGDAARRLDVLRDSRIGAHGASALVLVLLLKTLALQALIVHGAATATACAAFPAVARGVVALEVVLFPYARPSGLGSAFRAHTRGADVLAALLVVAVVLAAAGGTAVIVALATLAGVLAFARFASRRFGGLTGDVYGASIELAEALFLVLTLAAP